MKDKIIFWSVKANAELVNKENFYLSHRCTSSGIGAGYLLAVVAGVR